MRMLRTGLFSVSGTPVAGSTGTFSSVSCGLGWPGAPRTTSYVTGSSSLVRPKGLA